ncbi:MAG TPA: class I SAM-dependent methyltransferase [Polyangiaceae bacterium]|jgi:SAM-dependent methyltransferase|nr:class I SAM-dependent methyltransferase [Polyangiaceae bacterium]
MASPRTSAFRRVARSAANFVDLQWTLIIAALEGVAPLARGRLLDVGSGDKPYLEIFAPFVDEYIGVEHEASFEQTSSAGHSRGPDVLYDGEHLPFDSGTFETVLCVQTLEHTPKPQVLVRELARVLRPDGRLLLMAPFSFRLHEEPHDYFRYSPHGLRVLCEEAGLEIERCEPLGSFWSVIGHKLNSYLAFRVARAGALAQSLEKLGHEATQRARPRYWLLPPVALTMASIAVAARALDRVASDPSESLGFMVIAHLRQR